MKHYLFSFRRSTYQIINYMKNTDENVMFFVVGLFPLTSPFICAHCGLSSRE